VEKFFQQPRRQGRRHLLGCIEDAIKEMLVHKNLRTLCEVRGSLAAVLNRARLMPTPPTRDIACAESPMHSSPSSLAFISKSPQLSLAAGSSRCVASRPRRNPSNDTRLTAPVTDRLRPPW
jgi:hypothetical protein